MTHLHFNFSIVSFGGASKQQHEEIMSKLTDGLTELETKVDKITGEVAGLRKDFDDLKNVLDEVPPEAKVILDRINGKLDAIDALNPDATN